MLSTLKNNTRLFTSLPYQLLYFNSTQETVSKNYFKFKNEYKKQMDQFKEKLKQLDEQNKIKVQKPVDTSYKHPYNSQHHPINYSAVKTAELFNDFIGPEQVSPHYENFLTSRKYLMAFWAVFLVVNIGASTVDLNWMMRSSMLPIVLYFSYLYFYIEGRKSLLKPLLVRFYRRAAANEMYLFETYYHENIEQRVRAKIQIAKNQMEYKEIHQMYPQIKADSINNFLATEYSLLHKHLTDRALNILKSAQTFEEKNKKDFLQKIIDDSIAEFDNMMKQADSEEIQQQIFESSLEGLRNGKMTYSNDPVLPLLLKIIQEKIQKVNSMSAEDQEKILQLTKEQYESIKQQDQKAKLDFIRQQPEGLDASLKGQSTVKTMFEKWGKAE